MTRTYVLLELSESAYAEVAKKMREAGYGHAFARNGEIDMHGIAVVKRPISFEHPARNAEDRVVKAARAWVSGRYRWWSGEAEYALNELRNSIRDLDAMRS